MKNLDKHGNKWRVRWTDERGKRRSKLFGHKRDATLFHHSKQKEIEEIRRGLALGYETNKRCSDLFEYYLEHYTPNKRSPKDDISIISNHLGPFFGDILLIDVRLHLDPFKRSKRDLSPKTLHNILNLFGTMLNVAYEKRWIIEKVSIRKPSLLRAQEFSYLKSKEEINRFLEASKEEGTIATMMYRTAIYTGMRAGELACLTWSDVDLSKRLIKVSKSFNGPTKSGDIRYIPILNALYPALKEYRELACTEVVFPNARGYAHAPSAHIFKSKFKRTLDRGGFPKITRQGQRSDYYICFHDLRHTFASHWMMNGGDIFKLQKILGHKDTKTTMVYSHLSPDAYKGDYDIF